MVKYLQGSEIQYRFTFGSISSFVSNNFLIMIIVTIMGVCLLIRLKTLVNEKEFQWIDQ